MPSDQIPIGLRNALESGNCVLFLGSGVGRHAFDAAGKPAPNGAQLSAQLIERFQLDVPEDTPLAKVAKLVELRKGRPELQSYLSERLADLRPDEAILWLTRLTWKAIFTTNYDRVIERAYELNPNPHQTPISISVTSELVTYDPRFQVPVYHVHGSLFDAPQQRVVITTDDYARFHEKRRMLFEHLRHNMATMPILYLGYSHTDPDWQSPQSWLKSSLPPLPRAPTVLFPKRIQ